jgi:hypothetical protein
MVDRMQRAPRILARIAISAAVITYLALRRCSPEHGVIVTDASGAPVAGAQIATISRSLEMDGERTDGKGRAAAPSNLNDATWIKVSKLGFATQQVSLPAQWPIHVTLLAERLEILMSQWQELSIVSPRDAFGGHAVSKSDLLSYLADHRLPKELVVVVLDNRDVAVGQRPAPDEIASFFHEQGFSRVLVKLAPGATTDAPVTSDGVLLDSIESNYQ